MPQSPACKELWCSAQSSTASLAISLGNKLHEILLPLSLFPLQTVFPPRFSYLCKNVKKNLDLVGIPQSKCALGRGLNERVMKITDKKERFMGCFEDICNRIASTWGDQIFLCWCECLCSCSWRAKWEFWCFFGWLGCVISIWPFLSIWMNVREKWNPEWGI